MSRCITKWTVVLNELESPVGPLLDWASTGTILHYRAGDPGSLSRTPITFSRKVRVSRRESTTTGVRLWLEEVLT